MCVFDDMVNFYAEVEKIGWMGLSNSYGFSSNYFTHNILMICLYKLFGQHQIFYYIVGCIWHATNAILLLKLLKCWTASLDAIIHQYVPICTSVLWLCSCMQSENVLYMGTLQYQYVATVLLSILLVFHKWTIHLLQCKWHLFFIHLFFISGLFAQEISIFFPIILLVVMGYYAVLKINMRHWFAFWMQWFLPMITAVVLYFCLHFYTFHNWLPHYGDAHLQGITLPNITANFSINFFKNILMANYGSDAYCKALHAASKQEANMLLIWISVLFSSLFIAFYRSKKTGIFMMFLLLLFAFLYAPSANFGIYTYENIINDRLLFFPRLFLFAVLILLLISIHKYLVVVIYAFIGLQIILVIPTVRQYQIAGNMMQLMQRTFTYVPNKKIFFLNLPLQYKGVEICRYPYSIARNLMVYNHIDLQNNYVSIARKPKWTTEEDFTIRTINDTTIEVQNNIAKELFEVVDVNQSLPFSNQYQVQYLPNNRYKLCISKSMNNARLIYLSNDGFHDYKLGVDTFKHIFYR
jgi:hypothetical protein